MPSLRKQKHKRALLAARGPACGLCGREFAADALTLDHIQPRALGGTNARRNLQLACRPCNEAKAATAPVRDG
jgi:5-methylcytosine-specific restriction endonuclease McrA